MKADNLHAQRKMIRNTELDIIPINPAKWMTEAEVKKKDGDVAFAFLQQDGDCYQVTAISHHPIGVMSVMMARDKVPYYNISQTYVDYNHPEVL